MSLQWKQTGEYMLICWSVLPYLLSRRCISIDFSQELSISQGIWINSKTDICILYSLCGSAAKELSFETVEFFHFERDTWTLLTSWIICQIHIQCVEIRRSFSLALCFLTQQIVFYRHVLLRIRTRSSHPYLKPEHWE